MDLCASAEPIICECSGEQSSRYLAIGQSEAAGWRVDRGQVNGRKGGAGSGSLSDFDCTSPSSSSPSSSDACVAINTELQMTVEKHGDLLILTLSDYPEAETGKLQVCNCVFCLECLREYVELGILDGAGSPITCPDLACENSGTLLDSEIAFLAPSDRLELHQRLQFERGVQLDPSKTWCPELNCQAVCRLTPGTEGKAVPVSCPMCQAVFCCCCRSQWTDGHSCSPQQPLMMPPTADGSETKTHVCTRCPIGHAL
ncbi:hypothetical protein DNTS_021474 [Danionella cerebrum]|uniref:RBR-type E3 ubiquitin transferase n=1 Tax=Danionella cerebrum TaxID=2873325 RepID=A0A553R0B3_9TELE|nr:hypothetical protein DNTS_021474 [Danionella translucida]